MYKISPKNKKPKFWTFQVFRLYEKPKNLGFSKTFSSPALRPTFSSMAQPFIWFSCFLYVARLPAAAFN